MPSLPLQPLVRPALRVAVIGSGPGGCYVAQRLARHAPRLASIDIYERNPVPYGLVRYGVAPDHQDVKNVADVFNEDLFPPTKSSSIASAANHSVTAPIRLFANRQLGRDFSVADLARRYLVRDISGVDAPPLLLAVFCLGPNIDASFRVPAVDHALGRVANFVPARELVQWYNALPETIASTSTISEISLRNSTQTRGVLDFGPITQRNKQQQHQSNGATCVVFGHGNVALDIARVLLCPRNHLQHTDIADDALNILHPQTTKTNQTSHSLFRKVMLIGRRGPLQVSFSTKELREVFKLATEYGFKLNINRDLVLNELTRHATALSKSRLLKRKGDLLRQMATSNINVFGTSEDDISKNKILEFRFLQSPQGILTTSRTQTNTSSSSVENDSVFEPTEDSTNLDVPTVTKRVSGVLLQQNEFIYDPKVINTAESIENAKAIPIPTDKTTPSVLNCDLIVQSIGYRCSPVPGGTLQVEGHEFAIPYDSKYGIVPNVDGVVHMEPITWPHDSHIEDNPLKYSPTTFVSGWLKTGCKGKIVDSMQSSWSTADMIIGELRRRGLYPEANSTSNDENSSTVLSTTTIEQEDPIIGSILEDSPPTSDEIVVTAKEWNKIDAYEITQGKPLGKIRQKLPSFSNKQLKLAIGESKSS